MHETQATQYFTGLYVLLFNNKVFSCMIGYKTLNLLNLKDDKKTDELA